MFCKRYIAISPSRHFDVRMTSYENFIVDFGFEIRKYSPAPNLSKIKPISWQICKFLHFPVPRHIHNKRLPWQHLKLMRIVTVCKMTPIGVRLNLKNFILIPCAVLELLRKVSQGGAESAPPPLGEIGLSLTLLYTSFMQTVHPGSSENKCFLLDPCHLIFHSIVSVFVSTFPV